LRYNTQGEKLLFSLPITAFFLLITLKTLLRYSLAGIKLLVDQLKMQTRKSSLAGYNIFVNIINGFLVYQMETLKTFRVAILHMMSNC
jgi:hypothetical protein